MTSNGISDTRKVGAVRVIGADIFLLVGKVIVAEMPKADKRDGS
jgi:hypothetical protein